MCLLLVSVPACELGDRALAGECPAGETCSDATPNGLRFDAPNDGGFWDDSPPAVAVGGRLSITLHNRAYGPLPAFDVAAEDPHVLSASVQPKDGVGLVGVAAGATKLRVFEAGTKALLDRRTIVVADAARLVVQGCGADSETPLGDGQGGLLAGVGTMGVAAFLWSAEGTRLVDEELIFDPPGQPSAPPTWRTSNVTVPKSGSLTVRATVGALSAAIEVPTFDEVEGYEATWAPLSYDPEQKRSPLADAELSMSAFPSICARGATQGRTLCNAPGDIQIVRDGVTLGVGHGCWWPEVEIAPGPATVRIGEAGPVGEDGYPHVVGESYEITFVP